MGSLRETLRYSEGSRSGQPMRLPQLSTQVHPGRVRQSLGNVQLIFRSAGKMSALIAAIVLAHLVGPVAKQKNSQIISGAREIRQL